MQKRRNNRRRDLVISGLTVGVIALGVLVLAGGLAGVIGTTAVASRGVGLVEVNGVIRDARPIIRQLKHFTEKGNAPVILLRINSPGGTVGAAQEIHRQVVLTRQQGVKVVASLGDLAASGGYYIAAAADSIMANPGTITGSIGVIAEFLNADTLMQKIGIGFTFIKSGKYKDLGTPSRPLSPDERRVVQTVVDDAYKQFLDAVHEGRGIPYDDLDPLAQGQVYTGSMALNYGLIDTLGNFENAVRFARDIGRLKPDAPLLRAPVRDRSLVQRLIGEAAVLWSGPSMRVSYLMP